MGLSNDKIVQNMHVGLNDRQLLVCQTTNLHFCSLPKRSSLPVVMWFPPCIGGTHLVAEARDGCQPSNAANDDP